MSAYPPASAAYTVTLDERSFAVDYCATAEGTSVTVDGVVVSRQPLGPADVHRFVLADLEVQLAVTLDGPLSATGAPDALRIAALTLSLDDEVVLEAAPDRMAA